MRSISRLRPMQLLPLLALCAGAWASPWAHAAEAPVPSRFSDAVQAKALSVGHWQAIADDMVQALEGDFKARDIKGVHVRNAPNSVFAAHLAVFMRDSFHKAGRTVFTTPQDGVLTVEVNNSFVAHTSKAAMAPELKWTALTAGVMVLREVARASVPAALLAGALTADFANKATKQPPRTEILVSATVAQGDHYVSRQSRVYYVDGLDADLFGSTRIEPEPEEDNTPSDLRVFRIKSN